jgi:hypothetical protein
MGKFAENSEVSPVALLVAVALHLFPSSETGKRKSHSKLPFPLEFVVTVVSSARFTG